MGKSIIMAVFITLVAVGLLFFTIKTFAATPLLKDFLGSIPKPVSDLFNKFQDYNFGQNSSSTPVNTILHFFNVVLIGFLKAIGSVFVWLFHAIANGLETLIFSR